MRVKNDRQQIIVFIDDSGVFADSEAERFFVYAGYVLIGNSQRLEAHNKYKTLSENIKASLGHRGELKAAALSKYKANKYKNSLVKVMGDYESFACVVDIPRIASATKGTKLDKYRYKDFCIKVSLKRKLEDMIKRHVIDPTQPADLKIYIDEQHTATNGFYDLQESIVKEYLHGMGSKMFGNHHPPIFITKDVSVSLKYCDSSKNYLMQAADLLANRIHGSYQMVLPKLRDIKKITIIKFPTA
ncbi:DUF3800 domain-containing protein [Candidatus Saccharibacteria bacterium]|nr:MAG: DUF3800 domain-containing protein [Candidatus Saccharibacteria bacterium]